MTAKAGLYIEIDIQADIDLVWRLTQYPASHQRWDLRFSEIEYLPRPKDDEPQHFLYQTRIGFGLAVSGTGESMGQRDSPEGDRTSSLRFASDDWKSLITAGSGYWRYGMELPTPCPSYMSARGGALCSPEHGKDVPFRIENYAYIDPLGRETVSWVRTFFTKRKRRFDAYMIFNEERGCIIDYLGTHQHLAVDIQVSVADNGGLQLRSGEQRFYERPIAFRFPWLFTGVADVCEWYDDDQECFCIEVSARNRIWGGLFGYRGRFTVDWVKMAPEQVPSAILPKRLEARV